MFGRNDAGEIALIGNVPPDMCWSPPEFEGTNFTGITGDQGPAGCGRGQSLRAGSSGYPQRVYFARSESRAGLASLRPGQVPRCWFLKLLLSSKSGLAP
jgi:hypothetical protein